MKQLKKTLLTLVALFAMTTGAWATDANTVEWNNETWAGWAENVTTHTVGDITITATGSAKAYQYDGSGEPLALQAGANDAITFTSNGKPFASIAIQLAYGNTDIAGWTYNSSTWSLEWSGEPTTSVTLSGCYIQADVITFTFGTAGTALTPDATRKVWTLDAMPAGNVELQVAYFPGMLVKPTSLVGGTMEIEGVTDTALPDGFEKDDAGNIYVEAGKKFTVKAVPATGYHLVGWSDDATIKDLEREFTMPADGSDFTVTATFSDEFELTFDDVNFKTNQNITVKVGDADKTLDQDGKLSVKSGQTVTLTAKQGYKFRSVEAKKKAAALKSLQVCGQTIYYAEGETWGDAIKNHPTENAGWNLDGDGYVNHDSFGYLLVSNDFVPGNTPIDPNATYSCTGI